MIRKGVSVCVAPSHEEGISNTSGVAELGKRLAQNGRVDRVDFLLRTETIDKLLVEDLWLLTNQ